MRPHKVISTLLWFHGVKKRQNLTDPLYWKGKNERGFFLFVCVYGLFIYFFLVMTSVSCISYVLLYTYMLNTEHFYMIQWNLENTMKFVFHYLRFVRFIITCNFASSAMESTCINRNTREIKHWLNPINVIKLKTRVSSQKYYEYDLKVLMLA